MRINYKAVILACVASGALAAASQAVNAQDKKQVVFIGAPLNNPYQAALVNSVQKFGAEQGFEMLTAKQGESYEAVAQINNINTMIDAGVDGIMLQAIEGKGLKVALDRAETAGVKVVTVGAGPDAGYGNTFMMVGASPESQGRKSCEQLGPAMGGKGKVLELQGDLAAGDVAVLRSKGFNDCMKEKFPEIQVLSHDAGWLADKAASITEVVLSTDPDVTGVQLAGDAVYLDSVVNALRRQNRLHNVGEEGHVSIVGIDGSPAALSAIREGYVDAAIEHSAVGYAKWSSFYLKAAFDGKTFEAGPTDHNSEIVKQGDNLIDQLEPVVITKENVDSPDLWANNAN
ncbi:MAG: sugar ABC transporter substrate-binding protein [Mesorhizobium sp.]|nr:sugar ABC transporter substrate-binding protein [Mesorhizobium sp.]MBL8575583.1 sugar ABC transporter substrate-binding protein [Mesorhizobium sp.]